MIARLVFFLSLPLQYGIWTSYDTVLDTYFSAAVCAIVSLYLLNVTDAAITSAERKIFYTLLLALFMVPMAGFIHIYVSESRLRILDEKIVLEPVYEAPFTRPAALRATLHFSHDPMLFFRQFHPKLRLYLSDQGGKARPPKLYESQRLTANLSRHMTPRSFYALATQRTESAQRAPHAVALFFPLPLANALTAEHTCLHPQNSAVQKEVSDIRPKLELLGQRIWGKEGTRPLREIFFSLPLTEGIAVALAEDLPPALLVEATAPWQPEDMEAFGFSSCLPAQRCILAAQATEQTDEAGICQYRDRRKPLAAHETCYCKNKEPRE